MRIAGDVTITGKIYCPNALASQSAVKFNTEFITLTGEFEYDSTVNVGAWVPSTTNVPTLQPTGIYHCHLIMVGASPTTNAEGTNTKATDGGLVD